MSLCHSHGYYCICNVTVDPKLNIFLLCMANSVSWQDEPNPTP